MKWTNSEWLITVEAFLSIKLSRSVISVLIILFSFISSSQITSAKITFERKTNLYKKFKDENTRRWLKEEDKIKLDYFELFVSDTISVFRPQESELRENLSWATSKNTVFQNFKTNKRYTIKSMWGEELHLSDSLFKRQWKITESSRKIAGYNCRKAIWQANDSTRIYAWFSYDIVPSTGPESFNGLPGTILGLATEDGGVIYFAKKIEVLSPTNATFVMPKKKKIVTTQEVKADLEKRYGKEKWFKNNMNENFGIW
ncbi:MAG: GLPGLI family protein [Bacteroidota bacterium]|nr:GLPGLI family protein [Bacteroidota bacterium]